MSDSASVNHHRPWLRSGTDPRLWMAAARTPQRALRKAPSYVLNTAGDVLTSATEAESVKTRKQNKQSPMGPFFKQRAKKDEEVIPDSEEERARCVQLLFRTSVASY